jgi:hypothetical protein
LNIWKGLVPEYLGVRQSFNIEFHLLAGGLCDMGNSVSIGEAVQGCVCSKKMKNKRLLYGLAW